jgi:hypothetical protein
MKKTFLTGLALLLTVSIATGCGCKKKEKTTEDTSKETYNTNEGVIKDQEVEGLKLTNTSLVSTENSATLVTSVSNPTNEDKEVRIFYIHVKDKNGDEIVTLQGYVGGVVPAGQTREITSNVDRNLDNAYKVEYELVED